ncbi:MAG: M23 family metallopeptidase [Pseudomonadota bacterium]
MLSLLKRNVTKSAAATFVACASIAASPAYANANANAAVDIKEPLRATQDGVVPRGDDNFRQLFVDWKSLDQAGPAAPVTAPTISIPSIMPLSGARMSSGYGMRNHPVLRKRRKHNGIDLAAPTGTPVYATADGIVGRADWFSSYGLYIRIDHGADLETRYAHLSKLAVAAGERVEKGDLIGHVGSTGRSTGPHLHYEVRVDGVAVNPIPYMVESEAQLSFADAGSSEGRGGK